jgi:eukaryotic-like serine/threonine-protein kinase
MIPTDLPALIGGKYRPLGVIGEGAMGIVYSVEHTLTGEQLALKVMTAHHGATRDAIERFKREARASAKIKSEHVVRIIDADVAPELDRAPYLVMDLLDGTDLERASGDQPIAAHVVLDWLRQIARALDKAHRLGITHRDLKPENLFLTHREDGSALIKILDFGIAKISAESTGTTQSGQILGTPLYMSPEQARGDPAMIGPSSDRYALGLIAYKLLVGYPYWNANSVAGIIGQVLYEPMTPPSTRGCAFGPAFDQWFLRACNREPSQRFPAATEQIEALAQVLGLPADTRADVLRSNPGDSGSGIIDRPGAGMSTTGRRQQEQALAEASASKPETATIAQSGTLVSSSKEMPDVDVRVVTMTRRRRGIFYAVMSAAALLSILVVVFYRREPAPSPVVLTKPAAAPPEAPAPPMPAPHALTTNEPAQTAPVETPSQVAPVASTAPAAAAKPKAPARPVPAKPPPAAAPSRAEKTIVNDPLGDQK